jgi:hypothetical protein
MNQAEVLAKRQAVQDSMQAAMEGVNELTEAGAANPIVGMCSYEASRRGEEFMHRVNDLTQVMMATVTDEAVEGAIADGKVQLAPDGEGDAE